MPRSRTTSPVRYPRPVRPIQFNENLDANANSVLLRAPDDLDATSLSRFIPFDSSLSAIDVWPDEKYESQSYLNSRLTDRDIDEAFNELEMKESIDDINRELAALDRDDLSYALDDTLVSIDQTLRNSRRGRSFDHQHLLASQ